MNMNLMDVIRSRGLIFDGAMGSMLIRNGIPGGHASESWNLEKPDMVRSIHQAYFQAGADVATANTFGATSIKLKKAGLDGRRKEINLAGVRLAREAATPGKWVAGDMGPTGELLAPSGTLPVEAAIDGYAEQASSLADAGVDLLIVETMYDLEEALAAVTGIQRVTSLPIFVTMTFQQSPSGFVTIMGNWVEPSVRKLEDAGVAAVGANCSLGSDTMIELAREIRKAVRIPVVIQPNAGIPQIRGSETVYPESPEQFAENIAKIRAEGVEIVGGCCGTTPETITRIRERIG
jgi:methionine synthase I (cobalamin-dependent)